MSLIVARRYARALLEDAAEKDAVQHLDNDIAMIQESMDGSPDLRRFFLDPMISSEKKERVIDALFENRVHPLMSSFLHLLARKRRENLFSEIATAYQNLRNEQLGVVEAQVRIALPLSADEEKKITRGIEAMTGKRVRLNKEIDPSILGGIVIRVGDTVYDGSVHHQLETLKDRLEYTTFLAN